MSASSMKSEYELDGRTIGISYSDGLRDSEAVKIFIGGWGLRMSLRDLAALSNASREIVEEFLIKRR